MSKLSRARALKKDGGSLKGLPAEQDMSGYEEVDFSQNSLTSDNFAQVLKLVAHCRRLRILKLFKNALTDSDAAALAEFISDCHSLEELHLSHNHFTEDGVEKLVAASEKSRLKDASPLWLRLEQNDVAGPNR
eukprot:2265376-Amphidinium_carterae.1